MGPDQGQPPGAGENQQRWLLVEKRQEIDAPEKARSTNLKELSQLTFEVKILCVPWLFW